MRRTRSNPDDDGVTAPDPERERLFQSVFNSSLLEEVAEAISAASESHRDFYVERRGDQWRWSFATRGGGYPLLRSTASFLRMDYSSLGGVGSRVVGDEWCVQIVQTDTEPDAWVVLTFDGPVAADQVALRALTELEKDGAPQ